MQLHIENIHKSNFAQLSVNSSNLSVMNVSCPLSVLTGCSKCTSAVATHDQYLLQNDTIVLSMNSCGKSFHVVHEAVLSSAMLV